MGGYGLGHKKSTGMTLWPMCGGFGQHRRGLVAKSEQIAQNMDLCGWAYGSGLS